MTLATGSFDHLLHVLQGASLDRLTPAEGQINAPIFSVADMGLVPDFFADMLALLFALRAGFLWALTKMQAMCGQTECSVDAQNGV